MRRIMPEFTTYEKPRETSNKESKKESRKTAEGKARKRSPRSITFLLAFSFAICIPAVTADQEAVIVGQERVKQMRVIHAANSRHFFDVACHYLANGMRQKAYVTFEKSIAEESKLGYTSDSCASLYIAWAEELAAERIKKNDPEISRQMKQAVREALALTDKTPMYNSLYYKMRAIEFYRDVGLKAEQEEQIRLLDNKIAALEQSPPEDFELTEVASALDRLAYFYAPAATYEEGLIGVRPKFRVVADNQAPKPDTIKESNFSRAECYLLRANQLCSRLKEDHYYRIRNQRELALWFRYYNRSEQEKYQTKELAKLLHSNDDKVLFPTRPSWIGWNSRRSPRLGGSGG